MPKTKITNALNATPAAGVGPNPAPALGFDDWDSIPDMAEVYMPTEKQASIILITR